MPVGSKTEGREPEGFERSSKPVSSSGYRLRNKTLNSKYEILNKHEILNSKQGRVWEIVISDLGFV